MSELHELKSHKRRCELYLRALWGKDFSLHQISDEHGFNNNLTPLSYRSDNQIFLPANISLNKCYLNYYRAASLHAAAHDVYGAECFEIKELNLMQRSMIGLIEDLRVELLAIKSFPGLRNVWLSFHSLIEVYPLNAINLMRRLSLSVLDPSHEDAHHWVNKGKNLFLSNLNNIKQQSLSIDVGLSLANDLGQMRLPLNSGRYEQGIIYRDDNRSLWQELIVHQQQAAVSNQIQESLTIQNKLKESQSGIQLKISHDDFKQGKGFFIREHEQAAFEYRQLIQDKTIESKLYPEWSYQKNLLQHNWCTVLEQQAEAGSENEVDEIFSRHHVVRNRLRYIAKKLLTAKQQRIRKVEQGDEIDLDPMINMMVAMRSNQSPDPRVFMRNAYRMSNTLAISILLDLSESTNESIEGSEYSLSLMMRDAVLLLGETLAIAGEQFSISGFCSNGRHEVYVNHFKNFNESFAQSKARLSAVRGQYSTRLGAAIRSTADHLAQQPARKKLLLVVTDGAPSDIDVFDRHYLDHDSWHAVHSLASQGIKPFCLNLDSRSDHIIEHIFGRGRHETIDQLNQLPDVLFKVYMRYGCHSG